MYSILSKEKQIKILKNEIKKIEHEIAICNLVYSLQGEDTFEDLFRDNVPLLKEKINGIFLAISNLEKMNKF